MTAIARSASAATRPSGARAARISPAAVSSRLPARQAGADPRHQSQGRRCRSRSRPAVRIRQGPRAEGALARPGLRRLRHYHQPQRSKVQDELVSFWGELFPPDRAGASLWALGRSLAIDVGGKQPRSFPSCGRSGSRSLRRHHRARDLRAGRFPSVSAAFRYVVSPGLDTRMGHHRHDHSAQGDRAHRHRAPDVDVPGRRGRSRAADDFRPEIHDFDGLMMQSGGGEWIWRPLRNPKALRISSFGDTNPRGFGLMQRDRAFGSYQDLEARYAPGRATGSSAGGLGRGAHRPRRDPDRERGLRQHRRLLDAERASADRAGDGAALPPLGALHDLASAFHAQVQQSFAGSDIEDGVAEGQGMKRFIVDFAGGDWPITRRRPSGWNWWRPPRPARSPRRS